ncbi:MAG: diacylglycerol kinase family protein [Phycisphaerales bacterium]
MRVPVFANPRSGSGRGMILADQAAAALAAADMGLHPQRVNIGPGLPAVDLVTTLSGAHAVVVAGGDGTLRSVAHAAIKTGTPVYHVPAGNENLFAREFGMNRDMGRLIRALARRRVLHADVGWMTAGQNGPSEASPIMFLLMGSIGPDASVVHRLHSLRNKASGHGAYLQPILKEFARPAVARVKVWCDGVQVAEGRGMVVVANIAQYALRINPCPEVHHADGQLGVTFIPAETSVDTLTALARLRARWPGPDVIQRRGREIRIDTASEAHLQVDGEAVVADLHAPQTVVATTHPGTLAVIDAR